MNTVHVVSSVYNQLERHQLEQPFFAARRLHGGLPLRWMHEYCDICNILHLVVSRLPKHSCRLCRLQPHHAHHATLCDTASGRHAGADITDVGERVSVSWAAKLWTPLRSAPVGPGQTQSTTSCDGVGRVLQRHVRRCSHTGWHDTCRRPCTSHQPAYIRSCCAGTLSCTDTCGRVAACAQAPTTMRPTP